MKAFGVLIAIPIGEDKGQKATRPFNVVYFVFFY